MAAIHIDSTRPIGRIAPEIYGHFSEHLGRCIYEGIFVRPESGIPNVNGMRTDVVEALREIKIPVLRWPGGCFADEYHWQDGIGPRGQRKRMVNTHWGGVSPMAELRKENGHAEPWKVDYFGVGNENWGCGGNMTPEYYANLYGRWKALHYYARRFFAPVLISCHEEGVLSQNTNVNAELFPLKKSARLNVSNETPRDFKGQARWALRRADAGVIEEGVFDVAVPALSALWLPEQDFSGRETYDCYYSYELKDESGAAVGEGSVLFCAPKHFRFADPKLEAHIEGGEVVWPQ